MTLFSTDNKKDDNKEGPFEKKIDRLRKLLWDQYESLKKDWATIVGKSKDLPGTNFDLGILHMRKGNIADAIFRFKLTLFFKPDHDKAYYYLGRCFLMRNKQAAAKVQFLKALELNPQLEEAKYMLATLDEDVKITTIPLSVIREYFDDVAPRYNEMYLDELHYQGHYKLCDALLSVLANKTQKFEILDLGCGTGLCGVLLKEQLPSITLNGVDIAIRMLAKAKKMKWNELVAYDDLKHQDMLRYLEETDKKFHIIVAGLSLNYCGDLAEVMAAVKKRLLPGGYFAFSLPIADTSSFILNNTLDSFSYGLPYIKEVAAQVGLMEISLQKEQLHDACEGVVSVFAAGT